jgi:hypothetical protein
MDSSLSTEVNKMGQRFQILISVPEEYYNANNPNNRPRHTQVWHNQWLYGYSAVRYAWELISGLREARKVFDYCSWADIVERAINRANHKDFDYFTNTHPYFDTQEQLDKDRGKKKLMEYINEMDNNNGYLFVHISDDGTITYRLYNGLEDADKITERTPRQYIELFYPTAFSKKKDKVPDMDMELIERLTNEKRISDKDFAKM